MTENDFSGSKLNEELNIYCRTTNPGYAILVDAPWGAGKTFFVKKWMGKRKDAIYFSLYGISTTEQFEAALLEAVFQKFKSLRPPKLLKSAEEAAKHWSGLSVGLSDTYRRVALRSAPQILIIDDLERSELTANEVLGIINGQLEHNGKNLILISDSEQLSGKWLERGEKFGDIKEKVIGQILPLKPNPKAVVASFKSQTRANRFLDALVNLYKTTVDELYSTMLRTEQDFIVDVFERSETKNLRLLKQSLREFFRLYPIVRELTGGDGAKVRAILGSYVALSIAYNHSHAFDQKALKQGYSMSQDMLGAEGNNEGEPPKTEIQKLREAFIEVAEINLNGLVVSGELAVHTIARGDFDLERIRDELSNSPLITELKYNSWRILWHWVRESPEKVDQALHNVLDDLNSRRVSHPVIILHVFSILNDMDIKGVELNLGQSVKQYSKIYIDAALEEGQLSIDYPKSSYTCKITDANHTGLGFLCEKGEFFADILGHLEVALDRSFWNHIQASRSKFVTQFLNEPRSLMLSLANEGHREQLPNYAHIPVLGFTPADRMVDAILDSEPDVVFAFLNVLGKRIRRLENVKQEDRGCEWPNERDWITEVRDGLVERIDPDTNRISKAQILEMERFINEVILQ